MIQVATALFYFSLQKSLDIKPKTRLVGSNVNLPTSLFLLMEFRGSNTIGKNEPTPMHFLIKGRFYQKVRGIIKKCNYVYRENA